MSADRITLTLPSRAEYAKAVRMIASTLVSRTKATYDDLDDVRIAAEELFIYACDHTEVGDEVAIEFELDDEAMDLKVRIPEGKRATDEEAERRAVYATFILQSISDHYELSSDLDGQYLKVTKRLSAELDDARR